MCGPRGERIMNLGAVVMVAVVFFGAWVVYRVARKAWRKADVTDKLEEFNTTAENADRVKKVKPEKVEKNKDKVDRVLDL
jgi:hypothetical protein